MVKILGFIKVIIISSTFHHHHHFYFQERLLRTPSQKRDNSYLFCIPRSYLFSNRHNKDPAISQSEK